MRPGEVGLLSGAVATCACRPATGMTPDRVTADDFRFDATVADVASSGDCKIAADLDGDGTMDVVLSSSASCGRRERPARVGPTSMR
jgi:hypothetical protein